ncbi:hypothetical protein KCV87_21530 [Actinosynnema pretiosum subsp. pretiosum]|uniref:Uncharacterized protein n=1 Tax=Actinosynnema pretiosum subsp. pretiosum TaxID=103721 RepID=A0AA45R1U8_9PSEU|nr:hypothetical protein APASM_6827 [Actinosynnema pretiosum subsp. pretiosum]QUF02087.1 hypothetical protein KCV87_21530 [Actinosynnema pretiosum subsp. pretiosum]
MSEAELREGMLAALGDEPPLDFDADALIRKGRQRRKRKRALTAVGTTTALLLVTALSVPLVLDGLRSGAVDSAGSGLITITGERAPGAGEPDPATESSRPAGEATLESSESGWVHYYLNEIYPNYGVLALGEPQLVANTFPELGPHEGSLGYLVRYTKGATRGMLRLEVGGEDSGLGSMCPDKRYCHSEDQQPDGSRVQVASYPGRVEEPGGLEVVHHRPDGLVVRVVSYHTDPSDPDVQLDLNSYDAILGLATDRNLALAAG